jgi:uncharacterized protein (DUF362 family)
MDMPKKLSLSRRQFLKLTTLTTGTIAGQSLLTACGPNPAAGPAATAGQPLPGTLTPTAEPTLTATPLPGNVLGVGRGIFPARVVWAHNPLASAWDGKTDFWWEEKFTDRNLVNEMLSYSLQQLTGQSSDKAAWDALFTDFKTQRGKSGGYQPGEKIAIKTNLNGTKTHGGTKNDSFVSPAVASALLIQLVQAGVNPGDITVYDASRAVPDPIVDACRTPELAGVHFADFIGGNGREVCQRDLSQPVRWSVDTQGNPAYLPTVVTHADYLINLALFKGHSLAGVTLTAKNHFGSLMDDWNGEPTINPPQGAKLHGFVAAYNVQGSPEWSWPQAPMGSYNPLVDLIGHPHLGGKTLLFMVDALYGVENQNAELSNKSHFQSAPFNNHWSASLLLSQDPVALDSVGADILINEPIMITHPDVLPKDSTYQNFLHEAALADDPPSKTDYQLPSLGVHDHWNNSTEKKYGRNLGLGEGIELVMG